MCISPSSKATRALKVRRKLQTSRRRCGVRSQSAAATPICCARVTPGAFQLDLEPKSGVALCFPLHSKICSIHRKRNLLFELFDRTFLAREFVQPGFLDTQ